jgi:hypothetical protein
MRNRPIPPANPPRQREIRVFISSTFRDIQEEREELVKQILPQGAAAPARAAASISELLEDVPGDDLVHFLVPGHWLGHSGLRVAIPIVPPTVTDEQAP